MKKISTILIVISMIVGMTGCGSSKYGELKRGDAMDKAVYEFQVLMDKDKEGNRKSVYWDGSEASTVFDEYDSNDIDDGRSYRGYVPLEKELWKCNIYGMEEKEVINDTDDHVLYKGENWQFEVKRVENYATGLEKLKTEKWLSLMGETQDDAGFEKRAIFRGIREIDGKKYAGYVVCYRDGYAHSYEYSYMCIGNMSDCGVMINQIISQFEINFDVLEWLNDYDENTEEELLNG